jgi:hypothetical protein
MKRWKLTTGLSVLVISVLPYGYVQFRLRSHNWAPLEVPAELASKSNFLSRSFVTDLNGSYNVSLAFAPVDVEAEECLVGDALFKDSCKSGTNGLDLDWSVIREESGHETVVADYRSYRPGEFEGAGSVETVLGRFDAERYATYKIALRVRNIAPELRSASPKVRVEAARYYWENWMIYAQMSLFFAVVIASMGTIILGWGYFSDRKQN